MPSSSTATLQWLSLVGVIWLQSINGTNSDFPSYSSHLKKLLSISQLQLNNLAFASDAGKLLGWISGIATVYLPLWLVLIIGSFLGFIGYGFQYLLITHKIASISYARIFLLTILAGHSICWINTVCYIVIIRNFPMNRQIAIGIATSYFGLSAKVYTAVDNAINSSPKKRAQLYLLLNSLIPLVACILVAPIVRENKNDGNSIRMKGGFVIMFLITIATGIYAIVTSLNSLSRRLPSVDNLIGVIVCLLAPLIISVAYKIRDNGLESIRSLSRETRVHDSTMEENSGVEKMESEEKEEEKRVHDLTIEENTSVEKMEKGVKEDKKTVHNNNNSVEKIERKMKEDEGVSEIREEGLNEIREATVIEIGEEAVSEISGEAVKEEIGAKLVLQRVDFWLYFLVYFFGATLGLVFMNNLGQITESRGNSRTSSLVSLSSSFGFFGRLIPSLLDYFFPRSKRIISRPASIAALMAPMAAAFILLVNKTSVSLYINTAIIGVCTGAITTISVSLTTELFGAKNFGVNHNLLVVNIPIGSFLFGYFAALVYRKHDHNEDGMCIGIECYRNTFIIWGCFCFLGTFLALLLYARTRKFYSQTY